MKAGNDLHYTIKVVVFQQFLLEKSDIISTSSQLTRTLDITLARAMNFFTVLTRSVSLTLLTTCEVTHELI